jgi:hypothetical protein
MSWHGYESGQSVKRDDVVAKCEEYISSGKVRNPEQKREQIRQIRECPHTDIIWTPQSHIGWGASPMNPNNWQTPKRKPIY